MNRVFLGALVALALVAVTPDLARANGGFGIGIGLNFNWASWGGCCNNQPCPPPFPGYGAFPGYPPYNPYFGMPYGGGLPFGYPQYGPGGFGGFGGVDGMMFAPHGEGTEKAPPPKMEKPPVLGGPK